MAPRINQGCVQNLILFIFIFSTYCCIQYAYSWDILQVISAEERGGSAATACGSLPPDPVWSSPGPAAPLPAGTAAQGPMHQQKMGIMRRRPGRGGGGTYLGLFQALRGATNHTLHTGTSCLSTSWLTALRFRVQSSRHLFPSTTGLFRKISGLSLILGGGGEREKERERDWFLKS